MPLFNINVNIDIAEITDYRFSTDKTQTFSSCSSGCATKPSLLCANVEGNMAD